jgi:hypothetical protein
VHVTQGWQGVQRVAVVDVSTTREGNEAVEYFTNEFVSLGYEVVERSNLGEILKEGFSKSDYLDQETLAEWGRGKAVQAIVLFKLAGVVPAGAADSPLIEVSGWVRVVDVESGVILMGYNATRDLAVGGGRGSRRFEAVQRYTERVVDDIREAMRRHEIKPLKPTFTSPDDATTSS